MGPKVEVFILNYNGSEALLQTLESVLAQTYSHKKIILSDSFQRLPNNLLYE